MFSGLVETKAEVTYLAHNQGSLELALTPHLTFSDIKIGDSIAVNGICLSVTKMENQNLYFKAMQETLDLTTLSGLGKKDIVNVERSLQYMGRIGGHLVQGHIDFVGQILSIKSVETSKIVCISCPEAYSRYIVKKGYIAIDGMSITVVDAQDKKFTVMFIEHTQNVSIAGHYQLGHEVNIEVDILGKYIEKMGRASK